MKAAVFLGNRKIEIREKTIPEPAVDQVLIKITGCGVCGTDAHIFSGQLDVAKPPVVIGHEITGIIEASGNQVSGFRTGQTVSVDPVISCGKCSYCHTGHPNLCLDRISIGYSWDGGFQQYMVAPATHIYPISAEVGMKGGILVETLACVINGYNRLQPQAGKSALILGAGTVGCLWNQLLRQSPITRLLQTELIPFRQQMAMELGADYVIDPQKTDLAEAVFSKFPEGVDYVIDATGEADAIAEALPLVKRGGTFM
ncbi:alcohol dehydrogenase catalytic domain-containing protein, partial [bacterium]|nr:alcohol dehydrogenase catalytic domain-containing protein [bacterium]